MKKKVITERYKQLRLLITRAKEDANRWGTNKRPLLLTGIRETTVHDFDIYDRAYRKFVKQRIKSMEMSKLSEAKNEEQDKHKHQPSCVEVQLTRIADALERIVEYIESSEDFPNENL